jgi:hypothetical protein
MSSLFISEEEAELLPAPSAEQERPERPEQEEQETSNTTLVSPFPNIENNEAFVPGKFHYVNEWDKEMFTNAWQAITLTENWEFMKTDIESFMWSDDPRVDIINAKMVELGYNGHSGASFGYTMRRMQYLAKNGEEKFKAEYLKHR